MNFLKLPSPNRVPVPKALSRFIFQLYRWNVFAYILGICVVLYGGYIRLSGLHTHIVFGPEQGTYFRYFLEHPQDPFPPGPWSSQPAWITADSWGNYPMYYRMIHGLLLKYVLSLWHFNPVGLVYIWAIIDTLAIAAILWATSVFGIWPALAAASLYSVHFWPIFFARWPIGFAMIPLCVSLSVGAFLRIIRGSNWYWILFIVALAALPLFHPIGHAWAIIMSGSMIFWSVLFAPRPSSRSIITSVILLGSFVIVAVPGAQSILLPGTIAARVGNFVHQWMFLPIDMFDFFRIAIFGPNILPFVISLWVLIAGIVGIFVVGGLVGHTKESQSNVNHHFFSFWWPVWIMVVSCGFLVLARWYYSASVIDYWRSPSYIIILVLGIMGFSTVLLARIHRVWIYLVFVFLIFYSASMSQQYIGQNSIGDLTFGQKRDIIRFLIRKGEHVALCVDSKPNADDWEYLWAIEDTHGMSAQFTSECAARDCSKATCYHASAPEYVVDDQDSILYTSQDFILQRK